MPVKYPCNVCHKSVAKNHRGIQCDICDQWVHIKCNHTSNSEYLNLQTDESSWCCQQCTLSTIPFSSTSKASLELLNQGKRSLFTDIFDPNSNPNIEFFRDIRDKLSDEFTDSEITVPADCHYTSLVELNKNNDINKTSNFSLLHLNTNSLKLHFSELDTLLKNCNIKFDVIGISETGLNMLNNNEQTNIDGYHEPEDTFATRSKGGTRLYVSEDLNYIPRKDLQISKKNLLESTCIEILNKENPNTIVVCIYRHPDMNLTEFNIIYEELLSKLKIENKGLFILGDFNIDLLKTSNHVESDTFFNNNLSYCLRPLITRPTRITAHSKTLIDNIFTNNIEDDIVSGNLVCTISDHLPQFAVVKNLNVNDTIPKNKTKTFKNYKKFNLQNFITDFMKINWDVVYENEVTNDKFEIFIKTINDLIENNTPTETKKILIKKSHKPWITQGVLNSINTKNKLSKKYMHTKNKLIRAERFARFKTYKNNLTKYIRILKANYHKNYFCQQKSNLQKTWQGIREIIGTNSKQGLPKVLLHENKQHEGDDKLAEIFNKFYASIADKTKSKIIPTEKNFNDYLSNPNPVSFELVHPSHDKILNIVNKLSDSTAVGPNSIPTQILKIIAPHIINDLSNRINECIDVNTFPECLKKATITPVHKKDSKLKVENYRPVSLLSNVSKIFEKILHEQIYSFLETHNILFKNQFGFRKNHNTTHAITALTEDIRTALDENEFAVGIFVDLQKAFDTVGHEILLQKLDHYGIREGSLALFRSYLSNREQRVRIRDNYSSYKPVKHGVPQGSILGPLLFLIYINDLNKSIEHSKTFHFADDTGLLCRNKSLKKLNCRVNQDLSNLATWLRSNAISLNAKKTEIIIFRRKGKNINKNLNFRLSGQKLKLSSQVKYLGILIDEHLLWDAQINALCIKLTKATGILTKMRHFLCYKSLLGLYYALFESHLNYCIHTLGFLKRDHINKLSSLQKKTLKLIHFKGPRESATHLFVQSKILPVDSLITLKQSLFALEVLQNKSPNYFNGFVNKLGNRSVKLAFVLSKSVTYGSNSLKNSIARSWNLITPKINPFNSEVISKNSLKHHIKAKLLFDLI